MVSAIRIEDPIPEGNRWKCLQYTQTGGIEAEFMAVFHCAKAREGPIIGGYLIGFYE